MKKIDDPLQNNIGTLSQNIGLKAPSSVLIFNADVQAGFETIVQNPSPPGD